MTDPDYVKRRMDRALDKAFDLAESKERDRGVSLPPQIVGQMALSMFNAQFTIAMSRVDETDLPEDTGIGQY